MTTAALSSAVRDLLDLPVVTQIATVSPAGRPQTAVVWYERRGDQVVFFSESETPKVRNLRENPHIELVVVDPHRDAGAGTPLYVRLTGHADLRAAEEGIEDRLARRYGHPDGYPKEFGRLGDIVTIHVTIERVSGLGPRGFGPSGWGM